MSTAEERAKELKEMVRNTKVSELCSKTKGVISIGKNTSIRDTAKILQENKILSCPVIEDESGGTNMNIVGIVDVMDIMGYTIGQWRCVSNSLDFQHFPSSQFFDSPISKVINFSKANFTFLIPQDATVEDLLDIFVNSNSYGKIHRVVAVDQNQKLISVISQTDFVSFIRKSFALNGGGKTLKELGLCKPVIMAKEDEEAKKVLELMYDHRISSVALVDSNYHLVSSLKASDFRGVVPTSFDYFCMTAAQMASKEEMPTVLPTTTFREAVNLISEKHLHFCYIVSDDKKTLYGIVTLSDILRYLYSLINSHQ